MTELAYWLDQLEKGRISRREFLGRAAVLGAGAALGTTMASRAGLAAEPKRGGFARFGLAHGATTDSLDPATYPDTFTQSAFWGAMSNSLTEIDPKGNLVGDLAESFEASDGAKTWRFKLRKGVTFSNGKSVTPTDVIESFRHHMGKESKSGAKPLLAPIADIRADGADTVVFELNSGSADFPYIVGDYHLSIMPAKEGGGVDWQSAVRTGPFILEKFDPGVSAKLRRNPNYHKQGKPYFDQVEFIALSDVAARTNALTTGEVQFISRVDLKTLNLLKRNPNIEVDELTGTGHYVFPMHVTEPPFDNLDVRLALKHAVDREDIAKKIFLGHATPGNDDPIPPPPSSIKFAVDPQPRYSYDPDRAKHHLRQAGLSSLKVDLSAADAAFAGAVDAAVLFKEHAAKAGIDINVVREPNDGYWDKVWLKKPFCASYWGGRPTCDLMFTTGYAADAAWNDSRWKNPRFNDLLVKARAETDDATRAPMYAEMQQLVHDDGGVIVLVFNNYVNAHSKKLAHGDLGSNYDIDGLRIAERWWFA